MQFSEIVTGRRAIKRYDPKHVISDAELRTLFETVILSPSSFNLQHWRFVVVRDPARKRELRGAAFEQEQIETASAVIVVAAKLSAHLDAPGIYADAPEAVQESMLPMIERFYSDRPELQRDEALRSASLAAMTLMYAAYEMGYATGPMIGFDPQAVGRLAGLDEDHIPVMLVVLGKKVGDIRPRPSRLQLETVVKLETLSGEGLS